jgi:hypothetical protein
MTERNAAVLLYAALITLAQRCGSEEPDRREPDPEADTAEQAP